MLEPEQIGELLAATARCEQQNRAQNTKLDEQATKLNDLDAKLDAMLGRENQARGALLVGRIMVGALLSILVAGGGWLLSSHLSHGDRLSTHEVQIERNSQDIERARETQRQVGQLSGDVRSLETSIESLRDAQEQTRQEVLEALRRRR